MTDRRVDTAVRVTLVLALLGPAVSTYLAVEHYVAPTSLACPATGALDCVKVTTSPYSVVAGVPVALAGLLYFAAMTVLCLPLRRVGPWSTARVAGAALGVLTVLYLVYAELFLVDAICLWCTGVHVVTVALLASTLWWKDAADR